jgi:hypothetical protein
MQKGEISNTLGSIRQEVIKLLRERDMTAIAISQILSVREKDVYDHLYHIEKSVTAGGDRFSVVPSRCLKCGFEFKNRTRVNPPSRCPVCKQEHISAPLFRVLRD